MFVKCIENPLTDIEVPLTMQQYDYIFGHDVCLSVLDARGIHLTEAAINQ